MIKRLIKDVTPEQFETFISQAQSSKFPYNFYYTKSKSILNIELPDTGLKKKNSEVNRLLIKIGLLKDEGVENK